MRSLPALAALVLATVPLAACTLANDGYPSLLPRPIESRDETEPVRPDPIVTPDAALDARIAEKREAAATAAKRFQEAAIGTESRVAVARGVQEGSEAWVAAQTALAELDAIRGETVQLVSDLEEEASKRAQAGTPAYPPLDAAIAEIGGLATSQAERAKALEDALAR
ncbi:hypothetical protein OK349_00585 [Sphingomonas sp. BT-65]|uniref:hypothetical protein n=1 Tax=Sphingomonas sp. BT-65 TaxID=2989821 RepID=UPI0022358987|nr:hypothetical protein [Sphingomonas sp. BT-65]MCW4460190.1 hypothetical protein [Sphingomonas sp. BT-65]